MAASDGPQGQFDQEDMAILATLKPEADDPYVPENTGAQGAAGGTPNPTPEPTPLPTPAPTPGPTPAPTTSPSPTPDATPAPTPAPTAEPLVGADRAALRAARFQERRTREALERAQAELEALKSGKALPPDPNADLTPEQMQQLEQDFPAVAVVAKQLQAVKATMAPAPAPSDAPFMHAVFKPEVQEVLDQVPQLLAWQHDPAAKAQWDRAVAYDTALRADPDWAGKGPVERFNEAVARTQRAFGGSPSAPAAPAPTAEQLAALAIANAPAATPRGVGDFRGGLSGAPPQPNYAGMTDEQIIASLPVMD